MSDPTRSEAPARAAGYDPHRRIAFEARMLDVLNGAALALMTSIGRRTGLIDALATGRPQTPRRLAEAAGLDPRYVAGWLDAMVAGGVVLRAADDTHRLPPEHAAHLTRDAGPDDLTPYCDAICHLARLEDDLVACFLHGGRLPQELFVPLPEPDGPRRPGEDEAEPALAPFLHALACARGLRRGNGR